MTELDAHVNEAIRHDESGDAHAAELGYRYVLRRNPQHADALSNYANLLMRCGDVENAARLFRRAAEVSDSPQAWSLALSFGLHVGYDEARHRRWAEKFAEPLRHEPPKIEWDGKRPLRVGFLSNCFREHTMPHFLEPILPHLNAETIFYSGVRQPDATTGRIYDRSVNWRIIVDQGDDQLDAMIRKDRIDVLVDLDGHKEHNRMMTLARRPAPVMLSYIGYCADTFVTENIDHIGFAYRPHDCAPPVAELPFDHNGYVTFGHVGRECKITLKVAALWARVMEAVPTARLKVWAIGGEQNTAMRQRLMGAGIPSDRLELVNRNPDLADYLTDIGTIDVHLDPFPFCGFANTCELLWQGVPVVTLAGAEPYQKTAAYFLSAAGIPELIAHSPDQYVALAAEFANPLWLTWLRGWRRDARERLRASALLDGKAVSRRLEELCAEKVRAIACPR